MQIVNLGSKSLWRLFRTVTAMTTGMQTTVSVTTVQGTVCPQNHCFKCNFMCLSLDCFPRENWQNSQTADKHYSQYVNNYLEEGEISCSLNV